jgi:23S rRNA (guanosine2251-2'-O)-methyltransferase
VDGVARLTVYGRMPVLEALDDERVEVERVLVARTARGPSVDDIVAAARRRGVPLQRVAPEKVTRVSGNGRHDQGVVADVDAPAVAELDGWRPPATAAVVVLDHVTNPANVGMVVRAATAAGLEAVVLPRAGAPDVGPLVVKASAGVAFRAPILQCPTAVDGVAWLAAAGFEVVGLRGAGGDDLWSATVPERAAYVLGNETDGVSPAVAERVSTWVSIPLAGGVESLNVATAAAVLAYEVARRRRGARAP